MSPLALYLMSLLLWKFPPGRHPEVETRADGAARYEVVAQALADSSELAGEFWPEGPRDLGRAAVAAFGWSMGFRRDVQVGERRGPGGEACFSDQQPATLRRFARFDVTGLTDKQLAERVVGLDYDSLRRCFDAGLAGLVHVREHAERRCPVPLLGAFALYANGNWCATPSMPGSAKRRAPGPWIEQVRYDTMRALRARNTTTFPDWYQPP